MSNHVRAVALGIALAPLALATAVICLALLPLLMVVVVLDNVSLGLRPFYGLRR